MACSLLFAAVMRGGARRILRIAAIAAGAAWALYLVAMNVFLRTHLFRGLVSADPDSMWVEYTSAYSVVPGRIHVEDLRIRGRDSNIEWILVIDRCDFRVWFRDLAHRRFHADEVHGDGLSLRVRLRQPSFTSDHAAALPPVPGFSDPPHSGVKPPPITDAEYDLWSVWLEDVLAEHVRELWIDTVRYAGDMDVRGRWYFKPVRWLDVGPATVDVRALAVSHGSDETWVSAATGHLVATVHPSDVRAYDGANVLDHVSVSADLLGLLHATPLAERLLAGTGVTAARADAPIETHLTMDHGVLGTGSGLHAGPLPFVAHGRGVGAAGTVRMGVQAGDDGAVALDGAVERLAIEATGVLVHVPAITVRAPRITVPPAAVGGRVDVDASDVELPSIAKLAALLPLPVGVTVEGGSGRGELHAHLDAGGGSPEGAARLVARATAVRVGNLVLRGNADAWVRARQRGTVVDLSGSGVRFREPVDGGWWAEVDLPQATLASAGSPRLRASAVARAKDASPIASLIASHADVAARLALGVIPSSDLRASGEIVLAPSVVEARSVVARATGFGLDLELVTLGKRRDAAVYLVVGPVRAGIDVTNDETDVLLAGAEPWYVARVAELRARERPFE